MKLTHLTTGGHHSAATITSCCRPSCCREHRKLWPSCFPTCRLCFVQISAEVCAKVGPDGQCLDIVESMRGVDVKIRLEEPNSDLRRYHKKAINPIGGALQRRVGDAELLRIPEVDAGLVAGFDACLDVRKACRHAADDCI